MQDGCHFTAHEPWTRIDVVMTPNEARCRAFVKAIDPITGVVGRLGDPTVVALLAAALPPAQMWQVNGGASWNGLDADLNAAMFPVRWKGLLAAERAGAAHQLDATPAIWAWEVVDPEWRTALDALDVAMAVRILDVEGLPVTSGMRATEELVRKIADGSPGAGRASG
jgi:hypothetical protein